MSEAIEKTKRGFVHTELDLSSFIIHYKQHRAKSACVPHSIPARDFLGAACTFERDYMQVYTFSEVRIFFRTLSDA